MRVGLALCRCSRATATSIDPLKRKREAARVDRKPSGMRLMRQRGMRGFSLVEMMIVVTMILIVCAMSVTTMQPMMQSTRVANAYNLTLSSMRMAHDLAVGQRQIMYITFNNAPSPNTITITNGGDGTVMYSYLMPSDVTFVNVPGIPTAAGTTPDGFGVGAFAIDFDQAVAGGNKTVIYFYPDGTAKDVNGYTNNGVIYIARSSQLYSSRAITLWGLTGRLRGWRLFQTASGNYWREE